MKKIHPTWAHRFFTAWLVVCLVGIQPGFAWAQEVTSSGEATDSQGNPTGPVEPTGAPECTGASCTQGFDQGLNQGFNQGGPTAEQLGADENGNLPAGTVDTRQGAQQGVNNGVTATNSTTGANSNNTATSNATTDTTTSLTNTANDTTNATAVGTTGGNASSQNSGTGAVTSGNAGIGVTQVKNDNTTTVGGTAGLQVSGSQGDHNGDLQLNFGAGTANLSDGGGSHSVQAVNDTTGSNSNNTIDITTLTRELMEIQNDGQIDNLLDLAAITGQNTTSQNTGGGTIATGNANVAATLVNLLNTTVINGDLWIAVADIFGNLNGNIVLPDLSVLAAALRPASSVVVDAGNGTTGSNSTNTVDIDVIDNDQTRINNDAEITTTVNADAITGGNEADRNTGGATIDTGNGSVSASNISIANTTVEGGNWGLVIVNALNRWLGFLVGDSGEIRALSQEETLREIAAHNTNTGSDSTNTINVRDETDRQTRVNNDAVITNDVTARAITGENVASDNTGAAQVTTGDANVQATAVNIANTTVKDGSLFIAVVNIFGDWFGDLLYGGQSLASAASGGGGEVVVTGANEDTGANSTNTIDVNVESRQETTIDNKAKIATTLNANVDTGNNRTNRNTNGATITTGDGTLALHSRAAANLTALVGDNGRSLTVDGLNDTTGFDSENRIRARLNDERVINVNNDANVSTIFGGGANTGHNESNQNTIGGLITTGNTIGNVGIHNLVNQVILALAHSMGGGAAATHGTVDATLLNRLTGALSLNENEVEFDPDVLVDIVNSGLINNLIDLLFNTGGNTANENTVAGGIFTGATCLDGDITNSLNKAGVKGAAALTSNITQSGHINNNASVTATTGNNAFNNNTTGDTNGGPAEDCEKLAQAPSATPTPSPAPAGGAPNGQGGGGDQGGGQGGGDISEGQAQGEGPKVASAVSEKPVTSARQLLQRFPVAGSQAEAFLYGKKSSPWRWFMVASLGILLVAYQRDRALRRLATLPA